MKEVLIIMWIADGWKEYEVIDTSKGEKLERWGEFAAFKEMQSGNFFVIKYQVIHKRKPT